MKISTKLIFILASLSIFLLGISTFGWHAFKKEHASMTTIYLDRVIPLRDLKVISDAYAVSIIDLINKTNAGLITAENAVVELQKAEKIIKEKWSAYLATTLTPKEKVLAEEAIPLFAAADKSI